MNTRVVFFYTRLNMLILLVFLVQALALVDSIPHIYNSLEEEYTNGSDIVVLPSAAGTLELICIGEGEIRWSNCSINPDLNERVSIKTYGSSSTLTIIRPSYLDTGYYNCTDDTDTASLYIYFKDSKNLFVVSQDESIIVMSVHPYETVILPCRPTSPDVHVDLETDFQPLDNLPFFNPRIGFVMEFQTVHDSGFYECHAIDSDGEQINLLIHVIVQPKNEIISPPTINVIPNDHIVIGDNLTLSCTSEIVQGEMFRITWSVPYENNRISSNITSITDAVQYKIFTRNITILNVSLEDSGNYICQVQADDRTNSRSVLVEVLELKPLLELTTDATSLRVAVHTHNFVQWVVKVKSYPRDIIAIWNKNGVETLATSDKYNITTDNYLSVLQILEPTVEDSGNYTVTVSNNDISKTKTLSLTVDDAPDLRLDGTSVYTVSEAANMSCFTTGHPLPRVEWFYRTCTYSQEFNCSYTHFKKIKTRFSNISEVHLGFYSLESILTWSMHEPVEFMCKATNKYGSKNETIQVHVTDLPKDFIIFAPELILEGNTPEFTCSASKYSYTNKLKWFRKTYKMEEMIQNSSDVFISTGSSKYSYWSTLAIESIQKNYSGLYLCKGEKQDNSISVASVNANVLSEEIPTFINGTNVNNSNILISNGKPLAWFCKVAGVPPPSIIWLKDGKPLDMTQSVFSLSKDNQTLTLQSFSIFDEGKYECVVSNKAGSVRRFVQLYLAESGHMKKFLIAMVISATIVLIIITVLVCKVKQYQLEREELKQMGLLYFREGAVESLNPDLPLDEQTDLLPYQTKYEFPRSKLKFGKQIGAGAFGVVMIAEAKGIIKNEHTTIVAVKMVQSHVDTAHIKALASELKILVHLGKHLNIVNLLGACTENVAKKELLMILEYCRYGNIHDYLLKNREKFIDQIVDGVVDVTKMSSIADKTRINYATLAFPARNDANLTQSSANTDSTSYVHTDDTCDGGSYSYIAMYNALDKTCTINANDKQHTTPVLSTSTLLCWSFQIARGMEFLSSRRVLHGDLAARNILLTDNNVVKICDFGLAKSIYHDEAYRKQGDGPLPLKWMAIESLQDRLFTTQSDVWSFGIVLWELFSLAATPYTDLSPSDNVLKKLLNGYRMAKPTYATSDLYNVMLNCWNYEPCSRPSFIQLADVLGRMMENNVKEHYIELNQPFESLRHNDEIDYLKLVSVPSFKPSTYYVNLLHNKTEEDHNESPNNDYLLPRLNLATTDSILNPSYNLTSSL